MTTNRLVVRLHIARDVNPPEDVWVGMAETAARHAADKLADETGNRVTGFSFDGVDREPAFLVDGSRAVDDEGRALWDHVGYWYATVEPLGPLEGVGVALPPARLQTVDPLDPLTLELDGAYRVTVNFDWTRVVGTATPYLGADGALWARVSVDEGSRGALRGLPLCLAVEAERSESGAARLRSLAIIDQSHAIPGHPEIAWGEAP